MLEMILPTKNPGNCVLFMLPLFVIAVGSSSRVGAVNKGQGMLSIVRRHTGYSCHTGIGHISAAVEFSGIAENNIAHGYQYACYSSDYRSHDLSGNVSDKVLADLGIF